MWVGQRRLARSGWVWLILLALLAGSWSQPASARVVTNPDQPRSASRGLVTALAAPADSPVRRRQTAARPADSLVAQVVYSSAAQRLLANIQVAPVGTYAVAVQWRTLDESELVGFILWRQQDDEPVVQRVLGSMVAERSGDAGGAYYSFFDTRVQQPHSYRYLLELLLTDGRSERVQLGHSRWAHRTSLPLLLR